MALVPQERQDKANNRELALEQEYESAKERIQQQQETFKEFSHESLRIFRLALLLVGVPVAIVGAINPQTLNSLLTALSSSECAVDAIDCSLKAFRVTQLGIVSFVIGIILHIGASGYEARGIQNNTNPKDISGVLNTDPNLSEFYRSKLLLYQDRIEDNDRVISALEFMLGIGKFFFLLTVSLFTILLFHLYLQRPIHVVWLLMLLILVPVPMSGLPEKYQNADSIFPGNFNPPYWKNK